MVFRLIIVMIYLSNRYHKIRKHIKLEKRVAIVSLKIQMMTQSKRYKIPIVNYAMGQECIYKRNKI